MRRARMVQYGVLLVVAVGVLGAPYGARARVTTRQRVPTVRTRPPSPDLAARMAALEATVSSLQSTAASLQTTVTSLQDTVDAQAAEVASLQGTVDAQAAEIAALQAKLAPFSTELRVADDPDGGYEVYLAEANLHLVNGLGATNGYPDDPTSFDPADTATNGLGNLIIGYNEDTYDEFVRAGSHNLIVGTNHEYSSFGGIAAGYWNTIAGPYASVSGGGWNTGSGSLASVSGGSWNTASGDAASVSGGYERTASGVYDWRAGSLLESY